MDQELTRYLNDHLAASSAALLIIQELAENHEAPDARKFFLQLEVTVHNDRALLEDILARLGEKPSTLLKVAGAVVARIASIKLMWEKAQPGKLGLFEALEMLALGVHGKHMLWVALTEISPWFPEWDDFDFVALNREAIQQCDDIEVWRVRAVTTILADAERRSIQEDYSLLLL